MGKALKSWSGMRKYLEQEMHADSLQNRVRYSCTTFVGMDKNSVFEVFIDNKSAKRFSMETVAKDLYNGDKLTDMNRFWERFWYEKDSTPIEKRREFDDVEFSEALAQYRSLSINEALNSINPIVRMFAILDRRAGKRILISIKDKMIIQPEWLQIFYKLRFSAENIKFDNENNLYPHHML